MPWLRRWTREASHAFLLLSCASGVGFFVIVIELQKSLDLNDKWKSVDGGSLVYSDPLSRTLLAGDVVRNPAQRNSRLDPVASDEVLTAKGDAINHTSGHRSGLPSSSKIPLILFWTPLFGRVSSWNSFVAPLFTHESCPSHQCHVTTDQDQLQDADLILFSAYTADQVPFSKPWMRRPSQIWAFFSMESPANIFFRSEASYRHWDGLFNWTITYRLDSDVPALYGRVLRRSEIGQKNLVNDQELERRSGHQLGSANFSEAARVIHGLGKRKIAAALISNCHTSSKRESFIQKLQQAGLSVDVYGRCGTLATGPDVNYVHLSSKYKFFLAFENSVCRDYATEKVFSALHFPWIPVVLGGADYEKIVPPFSVIQANGTDIGNAEALVKLLIELDNDEERYLSYFRWREKFVVEIPYNWGCDLCKKLKRHISAPSDPAAMRVYDDLYGWWMKGSRCLESPNTVFDLGNLAKDFLHNIF